MIPDANPDIGGDELYAEIHRLRESGERISSDDAVDAVIDAEVRLMQEPYYAAAVRAARELDSMLAQVAHLRLVAKILGSLSEVRSLAEEAKRLAK